MEGGIAEKVKPEVASGRATRLRNASRSTEHLDTHRSISLFCSQRLDYRSL